MFSSLAAVSTSAMAAGFQLTEQSVVSMGRSHAGAGIVGDDVSAVWYNPAGMTLLPGTQFQISSTIVDLDIDYKGLTALEKMAVISLLLFQPSLFLIRSQTTFGPDLLLLLLTA